MAVKNTTQVLIGGKIITLSGYESEEYLQKVASYLNNKIAELIQLPGYNRQSVETKPTLLRLNVKDDHFKAKRQAEVFEEDLQGKDKEVYDLRHEMALLQVRLENAVNELNELKDKNHKLSGQVEELEKEVNELLS